MESVIKPEDAQAALHLVTASRAEVADRLITPWWYHPALGLLVAGVVAAPAARSLVVLYGAPLLCALGCAVLATVYSRMTGVWINGFNAGRASRWAVALGVVNAGAIVLGGAVTMAFDWWPVPLVLAVLVVPVTVVLGRQFDAAIRAELRKRA
jgi:hypothetical protein